MTKEATVARRRILQGIAAVAVVGFDPVGRTWVTEAEASRPLTRLPRLDGQLLTDPGSLAAAGQDFGRYIQRRPIAVLKPGSINDVVEMVRYAKQQRLRIAMRGQGHTTHGQAQVEAGIVIDSSTLASVQVNASDAVVGPGATWRQVLAATLPRNLTPPTLPNFIDITVGGNIAGGGIGGAAHRHGAVVDNVLELEVVTGHGQLRKCSATQNAALFNAVLGGLGQFGIVVRARIKLLPARQLARLYILQYPDVGAFLDDARVLALDERFDHLEGQVNADGTGQYGTVTMFAVKYYNPGAPPSNATQLAGLDHVGQEIQDLPYAAFVHRLDPIIDMLKMVGAWALPHPWFDIFMPESTVETFVAETLATVTAEDTGNGNVLLYPLRRSKFKRPFLRVPQQNEVFYLYDVLPFSAPVPAAVNQWVARNTAWLNRGRDLGGKRYNIGSANLTRQDWRKYFSPVWPAVLLAKLAFDPTNILTPGQGIFPWGRPVDCDD